MNRLIKSFLGLLLFVLILCNCNEPDIPISGIWYLTSSEQQSCSNPAMEYTALPCVVSLKNNCTNIFTDSTWTTESDTTIFITISYHGDPYNGLVGGSITEVNASNCTQRYAENTCIADFLLTKTTLTLYQTGKANTAEEFCLIIKEFKRRK